MKRQKNLKSKFQTNFKNQIKKNLKSNKSIKKPLEIIYYQNIEKSFIKLIEKIYKETHKPILILGRNNFDINILTKNNNFYIEKDTLIYKNNLNIKMKYLTIHRSKGLEEENVIIINLTNNTTGFPNKITNDRVLKYVLDDEDEYPYEEERRLFYVALTRSKEKIIIINTIEEKNTNNPKTNVTLPDKVKLYYRSLADIINSISYQLKDYNKIIDLSKINQTHDYNLIKKSNYKKIINQNNTIIKTNEIHINQRIIEKQHFSKSTNSIITKTKYNNMILGTKIHEILELIDLRQPNYNVIKNKFHAEIIKDFLSNNILKDIKEAKIYKEFEFIYQDNNKEYHGIIDLMLEYKNHIDIIDYKLKKVQDKSYKNQLIGYKNYIEKKSNKKINLYLYSIIDKKIYPINY